MKEQEYLLRNEGTRILRNKFLFGVFLNEGSESHIKGHSVFKNSVV